MEFEWDEQKAATNHRKHGVEFAYATRVFLDPKHVIAEDMRKEYGEKRLVVLGKIDGRLLTVVFTLRGSTHRLISARKGNDHEEKKYRQFQA